MNKGGAFKELEVLKELYADERPAEINLKRLASLMGVSDNDLAKALDISSSAFSRTPYASTSPSLNQWMAIFNLVIEIIKRAEPSLTAEETKLKMQRWLKLARPEFQNKTPLEMMLSGKSRQVNNMLEQLLD